MDEDSRFVVGIMMIIICHTFGVISTSGLGGHIAISGCPSTHLSVDTFCEFAVVEKFDFAARITNWY